MKKCKKCLQDKDYSEFHKSKGHRDGLYPYCKTCCTKIAKNRYWQDPEKERTKRKEYVAKNLETIRRKAHENYVKTYPERKEKINLRNRESYQRNKGKASEYGKKYRQRTKDKQTAKTRKRQALVLKRLPECANLKKIEEFYRRARELTEQTGIKHEVDHIVPLQGRNVSGFHVEWNLQILTKSENSSKGNKI